MSHHLGSVCETVYYSENQDVEGDLAGSSANASYQQLLAVVMWGTSVGRAALLLQGDAALTFKVVCGSTGWRNKGGASSQH